MIDLIIETGQMTLQLTEVVNLRNTENGQDRQHCARAAWQWLSGMHFLPNFRLQAKGKCECQRLMASMRHPSKYKRPKYIPFASDLECANFKAHFKTQDYC